MNCPTSPRLGDQGLIIAFSALSPREVFESRNSSGGEADDTEDIVAALQEPERMCSWDTTASRSNSTSGIIIGSRSMEAGNEGEGCT